MEEIELDNSKAIKTLLDMVLELGAWQGVIVKELARKQAFETDKNLSDVVEVFEREKEIFKTQIFEKVFGENGPDLGTEIINQ